jgi:diguanylate cyclase (GGDEF)-like protein
MSSNSKCIDKQQELVEKLKNTNILLERSNRITDSIMQITSEILSSGEINAVIQTILDKAIEIIPNAQKGSILINNGNILEFKASHGYDSEILKDLKFDVKEIFQYNSQEFYEPIIIKNLKSYNKKHLDKNKYEVMRKSKGLDLKSVLSCAIQVNNEFYGTINLDNIDDENAFSEEDKPLIKHLAVQIGIALKNAKLIERILFLSRYDSLTGIYNRHYFEELLMQTLQVCKATGFEFSLALLDINELKCINDSYGHEAGDLLLKKFAQGVSESIHPDDIFARHGGDEFAIIFTDKNRHQAESIIQNVKDHFEKNPFTYCGKKITAIHFGCGITEFPTDASEFQQLLKLADNRMYKDKKKIKIKPVF